MNRNTRSRLNSEENPGRREFLKAGASLGAVAALGSAASYARIIGANEKVQTGFIGVGNRGGQLFDLTVQHCQDARIVGICDVYKPYLEHAQKEAGGPTTGYNDYRKLLDDKGIDAVVIATPDHWHAKQFVDACAAGKDVYVEKPLSLTVAEGRKMVEAAGRATRITQMGAQRHSCPFIIDACKLMREGGIGKITRVRCFHTSNEFPNGIGRRGVSTPPAGLDWNMWLGPAPEVAFEELIWNYKFRWFWAYSGGQITNMATHYLDVVQMALGQDAPQTVAALGGRFAVDDDREIPDTMEAVWQYKDCLTSFSQINANAAPGSLPGVEIEFRGTGGTLYLYSNRYEIIPEEIQDGPYPARGPLNRGATIPTKKVIEKKSVPGALIHQDHLREFFACVKSRAKCSCDVETGHRSSTTTLIANIALRTGAVLQWDRERERFTNHEAANALLDYKHREPWTV